MNARERFRRWLAEQDAAGVSRVATAKSCDCSETLLRLMTRDPSVGVSRIPGRKIANAIERATASWKLGPLRSEEWDRLEAEEEAAAKDRAPTSDSSPDTTDDVNTDDARASAA